MAAAKARKSKVKDSAISLRVTKEDSALIAHAVDRVAALIGDDVAVSVVLRRALRRGLRSIIDDPRASDEEAPRRPRA